MIGQTSYFLIIKSKTYKCDCIVLQGGANFKRDCHLEIEFCRYFLKLKNKRQFSSRK